MLRLQFTPFPVLTTDRLLLRNIELSDKERVLEIRGDAETMQFIPRPIARNINDAIAVIDMMRGFTERNEKINWAITEKTNDKLLGMIGYPNMKTECVRAEVGYVMHKDARRRGIAFEALQAVLQYGFEQMGCHTIEAIIRPDNIASINLIEKAGFVREGYFREYIFHNGAFLDETLYSLLRTNSLPAATGTTAA